MSKNRAVRHMIATGLTTFVLSVILSLVSKTISSRLTFGPSLLLLILIVFIGVIFDIIGVAATAANEAPFHAMAADRVHGAKQAVYLVRNADKVSTFSNDIVGDVAGTLSGALAATIVFRLIIERPGLNESILSTLVISGAAALTVGGKALGKSYAINRANDIVYRVAQILYGCSRIPLLGTLFNFDNKVKEKARRQKVSKEHTKERGPRR
ncbi:MAG: hypothetical protein PHV61_05450 [Limnochordia bacterium]|nr:hypothetical protein [Limnochordia bacterium]MDD2629600.1 hypothetical protein [Limnochordia bacterium]